MGIFNWLFPKKKKEGEPPQTPEIEINIVAEDVDEDIDLAENDEKPPVYDVEAADAIAVDRTARTMRVREFGGAFDIKRAKDGRFVFNLYAANHVIVATSQVYFSAQSAITGIKSVIANAGRAAIEDTTLKSFTPQQFPKWEIYIDKGDKFRWRLFATNGNCILHSQGYTQKSSCKKGIESVIKTAQTAQIDKSYLQK